MRNVISAVVPTHTTQNRKIHRDVAGLHFAFSLYIAGTVCSQIDLLQYGDRLVINEFISIRIFFDLINYSRRKNAQNRRHRIDKMMANEFVVCELTADSLFSCNFVSNVSAVIHTEVCACVLSCSAAVPHRVTE